MNKTYNKHPCPSLAHKGFGRRQGWGEKVAIKILDATKCSIQCNRTNATGIGLQFLATDDNFNLSATVKGNSFHWHSDGLVIGGNGSTGTGIGAQLFSGIETPGNYWVGDGSGSFGNADTHIYSSSNNGDYFYVDNNGYYYPSFFNDFSSGYAAINFQTLENTTPLSCGLIQSKIQNEVASIDSLCCAIFPNPSDDHFEINYKLPQTVEYTLSILDFAGRMFYSEKVDGYGNNAMISTKHLGAGIYMITITSGKEMVYRQKLVVIR